jgi:ketosteroid isomerase-like protein
VVLPGDLDRVLRDYERAWRARDAQGLAALFVDGEVVMTNTGAQVRGRDAVRSLYEGSGGGLALRAVSFALGDSVAHILGAYSSAPGASDEGVFVLALKKGVRGQWLISADLDRANRR